MRIKLTSIMVDDQDKALKFYTVIFGFVKKRELPAGEYRWLTVISPEGPGDLELSLEPNANPVDKTFQEALFRQGIPITAFEVGDIEAEVKRLKALGVVFTQDPTRMGPVTIAVCADTCGNLIQLEDPLMRDVVVCFVCLHEIGHALGLTHSTNLRDIMWSGGTGVTLPVYDRYRKRIENRDSFAHASWLSPDDVARLKALWSH